MSLAAVIVETRVNPSNDLTIKDIIEDHMRFLPKDTQLYVFGSKNVDLFLSQSDLEYNFVNIGNSMNTIMYNNMIASRHFWNLIKEENVLIFQHDSKILRTGIEEFYKWDYIGAAWGFAPYVGNGGLSLRKRSAMLDILTKYPNYNQNTDGNEDIYFCNHMFKLGYKMPTKEEAQKFSVETIFGLGSFGCHAINKYHSIEKCDQILNQYK